MPKPSLSDASTPHARLMSMCDNSEPLQSEEPAHLRFRQRAPGNQRDSSQSTYEMRAGDKSDRGLGLPSFDTTATASPMSFTSCRFDQLFWI